MGFAPAASPPCCEAMLLCCYAAMLLCCYFAMLLCCDVAMLLWCYVAMLRCCCVAVLRCCYVAVLLCCYVAMLLCCYVAVLLCCCVAVLLCYCVAVLLRCCVAVLFCCYVAVLRCSTSQAAEFPTCESDLQYPDEFHATLTESGLRKIQSRNVKADLNPGEDYMVKASAPAHASWIKFVKFFAKFVPRWSSQPSWGCLEP